MTDECSVLRPGLFTGRTAVVTGGGTGIGKAIARRFAALGANLVVAGRHAEPLAATAGDIEASGGACLAHVADIRQVDQIDGLVAAALARFARVDFLINNAGGQFPARPSEISDRGWRSVVDLNLNGTWNMCSRVGPHLVAQRFGAVVNVVHIYSFDRGAPMFAHSGAARAGVVSLTRSLAFWWARHNVTINALAPGTIDTRGMRERELAAAEVPELERQTLEAIPARRFGCPEETAETCAFLCSPAARYITGAALVADGGFSLDAWPLGLDPTRP